MVLATECEKEPEPVPAGNDAMVSNVAGRVYPSDVNEKTDTAETREMEDGSREKIEI